MPGIAVLDVVMVLALVGGTLNGLRVGALQQVASLVILYVSVVITTRFYRFVLPFANRLMAGAPTAIVEAAVFTAFLVILYLILSILILDLALSRQRERRGTGYNWRHMDYQTGQSLGSVLNHLGGLAIGFVITAVWIGIGLLIYRFVLSGNWVQWEDWRHRLLRDYQASILVPAFQAVLPLVLKTIEPWLPGGLPGMFQPPQGS